MNEKKEYKRLKEAKLAELEASVNLLKAKAEKAKAEARVEYETILKDLNGKKAEARSKLEQLKNSSDQAWKELSGGVNDALDELGSSVKKAVGKFS